MPEPYEKSRPPTTRLSDGARKEQLRRRDYAPPRRPAGPRYAELHVSSAFSFLDGASLPEDLVARAAELGLPAVALTDRSGVYGAPRFFKAARAAGIRPLVGAEIVLADENEETTKTPRAGTRREAALRALEGHRLLLLAETRQGYKNLCKLLTAAARGRPKGDARATLSQVREYQEGLHCLTGGREGKLAELAAMTPDAIKQQNALPPGFMPLPHVKQASGGQVFPFRAALDERGQAAQGAIAGRAGGQQHQVARVFFTCETRPRFAGHGDSHTDDGLESGGLAGPMKGQHAVEDVGIGQGQVAHSLA